MCDKDQLIAYVYDELEGDARRAVQHHLASCLACREEVQGLRATRRQLLQWEVPGTPLEVHIPGAQPVRTSRKWTQAVWGLAAAAAIVLAAATTVSNLEITTTHGGVTIRTAGARQAVPEDADGPREDVAALQERIQQLEATLASLQSKASEAASAAVVPASSTKGDVAIDEAALLRRVEELIQESEARTRQQVGARLLQVVRQMQAEHNVDLIRLEQAINQHQGAWSDELLRTREEMRQYLRLVNQR